MEMKKINEIEFRIVDPEGNLRAHVSKRYASDKKWSLKNPFGKPLVDSMFDSAEDAFAVYKKL